MVSETLIAHEAIAQGLVHRLGGGGPAARRSCVRPPRVKRFTSELGGHAPVIVCEDADLDFVLKLSVPAKFRNAGQVCASPIRFIVHAPPFHAAFTQAPHRCRGAHCAWARAHDTATQMGPLTHASAVWPTCSTSSTTRETMRARILCHRRPPPGRGPAGSSPPP